MSYQRPTVAVLDVGVMDNHRDLVGQVCTTIATSYCPTSGGPNNTPSYPIYSTLIDFDAHPTWTPGDVRSYLKTTSQVIGPRQAFGAGMVDANAAVQ